MEHGKVFTVKKNEFEETLERDPFDGRAVIVALSGLIRVLSDPEELIESASVGKVYGLEIAALFTEALDRAERAGDVTHARLFVARAMLWTKAAGGEPDAKNDLPPSTSGLPMSGKKQPR